MQADCSTVPCFYVQVIEMARLKKKERHEILLRQVREKPFLTDEELAGLFEVSIQTIRLDRMELGIPEVRERIRQVAEKAQDNITALEKTEVVGDVIDLERGHSGISLLKITEDMVFARNKIAKGHFMFSLRWKGLWNSLRPLQRQVSFQFLVHHSAALGKTM